MLTKFLNSISIISCIIVVSLLYGFIALSNSFYFNGYIILIFLLMLLNPIANLCRLNKKVIKNPIFYFMILSLIGYITYVLINAIIIYINSLNGDPNNSLALNMSTLYFSDRFIYILISTIVTLLSTFLFKKEHVKSNKDNSRIMLLIILVTAIVPLLSKNIWTMNLISAGFNIAQIIFTIIVFFKLRNINTSSELQKYYLILMLTSLVSLNPISLVLSAYIFIQLDTFGLHI